MDKAIKDKHAPIKDKKTLGYAQKIVILLLCIWTFIIIGSTCWNDKILKKSISELAYKEADSSIKKDLMFRAWNANHGGVYVPTTEQTPPNPYLKVDERDITTPLGKELTLINPAYMTRQIYELSTEQTGASAHLISLNPIRPQNAPDKWEEQAMYKLQEGTSEIKEIVRMSGKEYLRYIRPFYTEKNCLQCHKEQGYKSGNLRGAISLSLPYEPFRKSYTEKKRSIFLGHLSLWLIGTISFLASASFFTKKQSQHSQEIRTLKGNELRLKKLIDSSSEASMLIDNGFITDCNQTALILFNAKNITAIQHKNFAELSPKQQPNGWNSKSRLSQLMNQANQTGAIHFEWMFKRFDETEFDADVHISTIMTDNQSCFQCIIHNISDRKQAEREQRESQQETERMNRMMLGREQRIIELKKEVNELLEKQNLLAKYSSVLSE